MPSQYDTNLSQRRYSQVAILLHWVLAFTMVCQLALGFAMPRDASGFAAFQLHKSIGIAILLLTLVRLAWRIVRQPPPPLERGFGGFLAKAVHWGFYAVLLLGPLTGWILVSTAPIRVPTVLFGVVPWPHLPVPSSLNEFSEEVHELLGWVAVGLLALHVAGAVRHHFILRDGLLARMAPGGSSGLVVALAGLIALAGGATFLLAGGTSESARPEPAALASAEPTVEETPEAAEPEPEATPTPEETEEPSAPPTWTIQPGGRLGFSVSNGGEPYNGRFSRWSGNITFDPEQPETAKMQIDIDLASASLGDGTMDDMLAGDEFFSVSSYPRATWRATSVRRTGPNRYTAQGTLTLKGASHPQSVTFTLSGSGLRRSVSGSATINRSAFNIGGSSAPGLDTNVSLDFAFDAVGKEN